MKRILKSYSTKGTILAIIAALFFSGCVANESAVKKNVKKSKSSSFSSAKYLTATGIGESEKEARLNAKAELAAIFESKVSSDVINRVRSVVEASGKETVTRDDEQNIKVLSTVEFEGVEIGKTWYDEKQRAYYALATLDRAKARENWQKDIDQIDDEIELIMGSLDSQKSDFSRFKSLKKARQLWMSREVAISRLRVLGYGDSSIADYDIKNILSQIEKLKTQFLIYISLEGASTKYGDIITGEISEILSNAGYLITDEKGRGNLVLEAYLRVSPVELKNPDWEFARAILNLTIVDKDSGLTVGEINENKRSSHLTYEEAAHKAVKAVAKMSAEKVIEYFGASR